MAIDVGKSIKVAQQMTEISSTKMAEDYGVAKQQVHRWRNYKHLSTQKVAEFAEYFGMDFYDFLKLGDR